MGGSIKDMTDSGVVVCHVVLATSGYRNRKGVLVPGTELVTDIESAALELGVQLIALFGGQDNDLGSNLPGMAQYIDGMIRTFQPNEVYSCLPWFNQDHDIAHKATLIAMRQHFDVSFFAYEMPQQDIGQPPAQYGWVYNALTSDAMGSKIKALECYNQTQRLNEKMGPVSLSGAECLARVRGSEIGAHAAERFLVLRGIKTNHEHEDTYRLRPDRDT